MEQDNKLHFFNRMKTAIFNLEDYGKFLGEHGSKAIKYFILLILLFSCVFGFSNSYYISMGINKMINYSINELPEFTLTDNKLDVSNIVDAYDEDYKFKLIIDTDSNISEDTINKYKSKIYSNGYGLIMLETKMIIMYDKSEMFEESYESLKNNYGIDISNKADFVQLLQNNNSNLTIITFFIIITIGTFIIKLISTIFDLIMIAVFGYFVALFCKIRFKWQAPAILSVYSLTLSIVLSAIYSIIYRFSGFEIRNFDIMYLLIAYVYIVAAIFMIRTDIIRDATELQKIFNEQEKIKEEKEKQDEENRDTEDKEDKEKNKNNNENNEDKEDKNEENPDVNNREPDGSEI